MDEDQQVQQGPEDVLDESSSGEWETGSEGDAEEANSEQPGQPSRTWTEEEDQGFMKHGCDHYKRRCKLVAPCCGEVFWCRHCHNAAKNDNEQVSVGKM